MSQLSPDMSKDDGFRSGLGVAFRLGTEMFVATGLGTVMGYAIDYFLGTKPWFLILGVFFGGAAGCLSAYRAAVKLEESTQNEDDPRNN